MGREHHAGIERQNDSTARNRTTPQVQRAEAPARGMAAPTPQQATLDPLMASPGAILTLQRTIGNAAVNQLLRRQAASAPVQRTAMPAPSGHAVQRVVPDPPDHLQGVRVQRVQPLPLMRSEGIRVMAGPIQRVSIQPLTIQRAKLSTSDMVTMLQGVAGLGALIDDDQKNPQGQTVAEHVTAVLNIYKARFDTFERSKDTSKAMMLAAVARIVGQQLARRLNNPWVAPQIA